jgi:hypothetical protein
MLISVIRILLRVWPNRLPENAKPAWVLQIRGELKFEAPAFFLQSSSSFDYNMNGERELFQGFVSCRV